MCRLHPRRRRDLPAVVRDDPRRGRSAPIPDDVARVVVRLIHTCGQVDLTHEIAFTGDVVAKTHAALAARAPVPVRLLDGRGGIRRRAPAGEQRSRALVADPQAPELARLRGCTRSRRVWSCGPTGWPGGYSRSANAPTALFRLLEPSTRGVKPPVAVLGGPVGGSFSPSRNSSTAVPAASNIWSSGTAGGKCDGGRRGQCDCERTQRATATGGPWAGRSGIPRDGQSCACGSPRRYVVVSQRPAWPQHRGASPGRRICVPVRLKNIWLTGHHLND